MRNDITTTKERLYRELKGIEADVAIIQGNAVRLTGADRELVETLMGIATENIRALHALARIATDLLENDIRATDNLDDQPAGESPS